jgi:type III pantothenate kinase
MILELDCGNSLIKSRVVSNEGMVLAVASSRDKEGLAAWLSANTDWQIARARLVSVRSHEETQAIAHLVLSYAGEGLAQASVATSYAGVTNGYDRPEQLGVDRWLAILGAFALCRRSFVVIDLGTAVTVDLVRGNGEHLGGYIAPGLPLLRRQLSSSTGRIALGEGLPVGTLNDPGRNTEDGVDRGCRLMLKAYVQAQIENARSILGDCPKVYLTGGDAELVSDSASTEHVPDLVFRGLAIVCP